MPKFPFYFKWDIQGNFSSIFITLLFGQNIMKLGVLVLIQGYRRVGQEGWSEAATNAPGEAKAIQAILGMNQKHILPCPDFLFFQPFPCPKFLIFSTSFLPPSPLLPTSPHFALISSSKLEVGATLCQSLGALEGKLPPLNSFLVLLQRRRQQQQGIITFFFWFCCSKEGDDSLLSSFFSIWFCCSKEGNDSKLSSPFF